MQFITALFGVDNPFVNSAFALGIVLLLIVLGLWALKAFSQAGQNLGRPGRKRLVVVDSAAVDGKRQVVIIRRDNVEHVIMTGGPQDLVIETGVPVPEPAAPVRRGAAARRPVAPDAATPTNPVDVAPPSPAAHLVSREAIDRLRDLARPAPLKPRSSLRDTGLMREERRPSAPVIPMPPTQRTENSAGGEYDSAKTGPGDGSGHPRFAGRNRFFRGSPRSDRG